MKKHLLVCLFLLFIVLAKAQNIGINTTGATPNVSALLDIDASPGNNLGLLIPRVALTSTILYAPITGTATTSLLVYNTNTAGTIPYAVTPGFYYWNGTTSKWISLSGGPNGNNWSITGNAGTSAGTNFIGTTDNVSFRIKTNNAQRMVIDSLGNVGIGTVTGDPSALLDIFSGSKGILIPQVALTKADNTGATPIPSPAPSLLVYNTTPAVSTDTTSNAISPGYYYWNGAKWISLSGGRSGNAWGLTGNSGTTVGTNFIGTTDANALKFKVNNNKAGYIDYAPLIANTALGYKTLNAITTGYDNTAFGYSALLLNDAGYNNTAIGANALKANVYSYNFVLHTYYGINNTAVGSNALFNTTGSNNTGVGYQALNNNTTGAGNTGIGAGTLYSNDAGNYNVAVGYYALNGNTLTGTTQQQNVGLGYEAGYNNQTGRFNSFVGYKSGYSNFSGSNNLFMGYSSGYSNYAGANNIFLGYNSGYNNDIGTSGTASNNIFVGTSCGYYNTTGNNNNFLGHYSGYNNTSGVQNLFMGDSAGYNNHTGYNNIFLGVSAGFSNDISGGAVSMVNSYDNVFIGDQAGYNSTTGSQNLYLGNNSGYHNTTGVANVFLGTGSGQSSTTGGQNVFVGVGSGMALTDGWLNVAVGLDAGAGTLMHG